MLRAIFAVAALLFAGSGGPAQNADPWAPYRFLVGTWTGAAQGQPGNTMGTATFAFELDGRILVRTSSTNVAARADAAAYVHEDRLVIYRDAPGQPMRAIYWDNEDHTIEYDVSATPDGKIVTLVSKATASAPRFRLVYTQLDASRVDVKFEMAPPGNPEAFKVYLQGVTRKTGSR